MFIKFTCLKLYIIYVFVKCKNQHLFDLLTFMYEVKTSISRIESYVYDTELYYSLQLHNSFLFARIDINPTYSAPHTFTISCDDASFIYCNAHIYFVQQATDCVMFIIINPQIKSFRTNRWNVSFWRHHTTIQIHIAQSEPNECGKYLRQTYRTTLQLLYESRVKAQ